MCEEPASPDALVRIGSYLDPPRADLAQMALAEEGIPTARGNGNFISWYWHYSNAVGGVVLYVRGRELERARQVLAAARSKFAESLPPWVCPSCRQRVAGQWDACWHCGCWADGTPSSPPVDGTAMQPSASDQGTSWWNVPRWITVLAAVALIILFLKRGPIPALVLAPCLALFVFLLWRFEPPSEEEPGLEEAAESVDRRGRQVATTQSDVSRALVRRAWQAAMFAALAFPPLGFYSMRLLWKLGSRNTPLGQADTCRFWAAFLVDILAILWFVLFCVWFVAGMLAAFFEALV